MRLNAENETFSLERKVIKNKTVEITSSQYEIQDKHKQT